MPQVDRKLSLQRAALIAIGAAELVLAALFFFAPQLAFALLGRPVLDPVISRQYGLFLVSVALMYAVAAGQPAAYRRIIWVGIAQRAAELLIAVLDWHAGQLPTVPFAVLAAAEFGVAGMLALCLVGHEATRIESPQRTRSDLWLTRVLYAFGGLQLFWAFLSTIFVQLGARLLGWKLQDAYTTQQQGIALLIIGLASIVAGSDLRRYRRFIWIPISSQALGVANAVNELRLGSISVTIALVQWAIEATIIAALLSLSRTGKPEIARAVPVVAPSA